MTPTNYFAPQRLKGEADQRVNKVRSLGKAGLRPVRLLKAKMRTDSEQAAC
jgi:hypothetical protein